MNQKENVRTVFMLLTHILTLCIWYRVPSFPKYSVPVGYSGNPETLKIYLGVCMHILVIKIYTFKMFVSCPSPSLICGSY